MRQLHPGCYQLHLVSLILRCTGYRRFGINFHTHLHGPKNSLIFRTLIVLYSIISNCRVPTTKWHDLVRHSNRWSEGEGFIDIDIAIFVNCNWVATQSKIYKMQNIIVFCSNSFSDTHRKVRSLLQCEHTGYEAGTCVCIVLK
jgi:hypothetical protein